MQHIFLPFSLVIALIGGITVYQLEEGSTGQAHAAASGGLALCLASGYGCSR